MMRALVGRIWFGKGPLAAAGRMALWPAARAFGAAVRVRNGLYDRRLLRVHPGPIPAVSVGNLTVGGTGKTPVAAWLARTLAARGARPAIVLRGYGADEPAVHARLNPDVPVVVNADRVAGVHDASARGANVAVMDDAFQHRRADRVIDIVLVAAERGLAQARLLPAGPFREPGAALRRATFVLVTRKTAGPEAAAEVLSAATAVSGGAGAVVALRPEGLISATGDASLPLSALQGRQVTLITGVGEPTLVAAQLAEAGASVALRAFPDHHAFTDAELAAAARGAGASGYVVCTLKDAVKIATRWPGPGALWYVSQRVTPEQGVEDLDALVERIVSGVAANPPTAG